MSKEEDFAELKKEIYRLGLEKTPSRTLYQRMYNKKGLSAPTTLMHKYSMSWKEILVDIGLGSAAKKIPVPKEKITGRPKRIESKEELDLILQSICFYAYKDKVQNFNEFNEMLYHRKIISWGTLYSQGVTWQEIVNLVQEKYNYNIKRRKSWKDYTDQEIVKLVHDFIITNGITNASNYTVVKDKNVPSSVYLMNRFNIKSKELITFFTK